MPQRAAGRRRTTSFSFISDGEQEERERCPNRLVPDVLGLQRGLIGVSQSVLFSADMQSAACGACLDALHTSCYIKSSQEGPCSSSIPTNYREVVLPCTAKAQDHKTNLRHFLARYRS